MKNISCYLCDYHRCIDHNICIKDKCKLKKGQYYDASGAILELLENEEPKLKRVKIRYVRKSIKNKPYEKQNIILKNRAVRSMRKFNKILELWIKNRNNK